MRNMINSLVAGSVVLAGLLQVGGAMAAEGSFEVINTNRGVSIQAVWTAEAGRSSDPWSSVTLSSPVSPGGIRGFTTQGSLCFVDVKIQFSDGVVQTFDNVNTCRGDKVIGA